MPEKRTWTGEWSEFRDPVSGTRVCRLTNYKAHSHHLYFTNSGWYDEDRRLLLGSDRENRTYLLSADLRTHELHQLTGLEPAAPDAAPSIQTACVNPRRAEMFFCQRRALKALDLHRLESRTLYALPDGFRASMFSCTADGRYVFTSINEGLSDRIRMDLAHGYVGFEEVFAAKPLSRIVRIATDGSGGEVVHEDRVWIGHVNTSPTQSRLLTFCHEGPWNKVDNRIWGMDVESGKIWKIRARRCEDEAVGHEYWHADGMHLGYHGRRPDGNKFFGKVRYDDTENVEVSFPHVTGHIHSNDFRLIVGDGGKVVRLWKWNGQGYDGPRVLCQHRCSAHSQQLHVHPRFSPDGKQVLFTSDMSGYGQVYLADVAEFESLPPAEN
ncbi:MAG TPA: oligogalacturonide lyase [Phycisphaerales bacterium]|nr:oligogalacturonide lyase [Phycisphaerales bacterium]